MNEPVSVENAHQSMEVAESEKGLPLNEDFHPSNRNGEEKLNRFDDINNDFALTYDSNDSLQYFNVGKRNIE
ncbi:unnamed protein product [Rotaria sordida]|uniref:Uncharacterized protein n=1 Tax=Rotaria sordida TaxID=392033 RepID=A0A819QSW3_9BILA|nr:unnamed protein product [Rotaria sordida]